MLYLNPIIFINDPTVCPQCGKPEDKKVVCARCGYEYEEEETGCMFVILFIAFIAMVIVMLLILTQWLWGIGALHEIIINDIKYLLSLEL